MTLRHIYILYNPVKLELLAVGNISEYRYYWVHQKIEKSNQMYFLEVWFVYVQPSLQSVGTKSSY